MFNIILLFCYYLPLENGLALHLNKLESPSSMDALCQAFMKLARDSREEDFKIFSICLHFCYYPTLEKGVAFHLNKQKSPPSKAALCHVR